MVTTIQVSEEFKEKISMLPGTTFEQKLKAGLGIEKNSSQVITIPRSRWLVPAGTKYYDEELVGIDGIITSVEIDFPNGTAGLVDVAVRYRGLGETWKNIVPTVDNAWISRDGTPAKFDNISFPVKVGGLIRVIWENNGSHDHYIKTDITIS